MRIVGMKRGLVRPRKERSFREKIPLTVNKMISLFTFIKYFMFIKFMYNFNLH